MFNVSMSSQTCIQLLNIVFLTSSPTLPALLKDAAMFLRIKMLGPDKSSRQAKRGYTILSNVIFFFFHWRYSSNL